MPLILKTYIILLNYKNWEDTVQCMISLNNLPEFFEVIVIDNNSQNESINNIKKTIPTSIKYIIHYLQLDENLGFAKGNNAGIRFALSKNHGDFFWILNNDTVVAPDSLQKLILAAQDGKEKKVGLLGSKLLYYHDKTILQAVGGYYNKWWGYTKEIGNGEVDKGQYDIPNPAINILIGASLFATKSFLDEVGLIGEDYFIYYEEHDWAERAKRKGWQIEVVNECKIYHKQGASIGANAHLNNQKSKLSDFYSFRNKLLFTYKYHPFCLPTVYLSFGVVLANRIARKQWDRIPLMFRILLYFRIIEWKG